MGPSEERTQGPSQNRGRVWLAARKGAPGRKCRGRLESKLGGSLAPFGDVWAGWYSRATGLQGFQSWSPEHISCDPHELSPSQAPPDAWRMEETVLTRSLSYIQGLVISASDDTKEDFRLIEKSISKFK